MTQAIRRSEELRQQNEQMMRQMYNRNGGPPPPSMPAMPSPASQGIVFGEFDDPAAVLQHIYPQLSEVNRLHGVPAQQIDKVLASTPAPPQLPGGKASLVSMLWTLGTGTAAEHFHFEGRMESSQIGTGVTMLYSSGLRAHVATFDRDLPTLWAVVQSFKPDNDQINRLGQQRVQATAEAGREQLKIQADANRQNQQAMFDRNQAIHDAQADRFDRFQHSIEAQSTAGHRASADFSEMIGGYQKVVNTRTGEERSVDYYNSTGIVAGLNESAGDNTEWVAVHRRDEQYPLSR